MKGWRGGGPLRKVGQRIVGTMHQPHRSDPDDPRGDPEPIFVCPHCDRTDEHKHKLLIPPPQTSTPPLRAREPLTAEQERIRRRAKGIGRTKRPRR